MKQSFTSLSSNKKRETEVEGGKIDSKAVLVAEEAIVSWYNIFSSLFLLFVIPLSCFQYVFAIALLNFAGTQNVFNVKTE